MIEFRDITKTYFLENHTVSALHPTNLRIESGEFVALTGTSGSGKTTAMNIMGLLDKPTSGHYFLDKKEVSVLNDDSAAHLRNQTFGFIFQLFLLLPRFTALQNVALPLKYGNMEVSEIKKRALASLEKVGLAELADHKPNQLSGGQQQRVAVARALVTGPKILLADEPTGSLDSKTGKIIMDLLLDINRNHKTTVVIVTHDNAIATQCDRIVRIADGRVIA